jgi:tRNA-(ms[2]io[6]A)-hydroxylase
MLCLKVPTDGAWVAAALGDLDRVLVDHAHCEMKAASNALSLVARHGGSQGSSQAGSPGDYALVRALTDLAREELDHFQRVIAFLERRGLALGPPPVDDYAAELRRKSGDLPRDASIPPLVDRLLVGALIEARSCERFGMLVDAMQRDPSLAASGELVVFYEELFACEAKHYRTYVDLAHLAAPSAGRAIEARLSALAELEGAIVRDLARRDARATVHG